MDITKDKAEALIDSHNASIDHYINVTLKEHFGTDTITLGQWFEAQQLLKAQCFYEKGSAIQMYLRDAGYDVKMSMQTNKLYWLGGMNREVE